MTSLGSQFSCNKTFELFDVLFKAFWTSKYYLYKRFQQVCSWCILSVSFSHLAWLLLDAGWKSTISSMCSTLRTYRLHLILNCVLLNYFHLVFWRWFSFAWLYENPNKFQKCNFSGQDVKIDWILRWNVTPHLQGGWIKIHEVVCEVLFVEMFCWSSSRGKKP